LRAVKTGQRDHAGQRNPNWRDYIGRGLQKHQLTKGVFVFAAAPRSFKAERTRDQRWRPTASPISRCLYCGRACDANGHCRGFDESPGLRALVVTAVAALLAQRRRPVAICAAEECLRLVLKVKRGPKTQLCRTCQGREPLPIPQIARRQLRQVATLESFQEAQKLAAEATRAALRRLCQASASGGVNEL
jgi:hypothetical protein